MSVVRMVLGYVLVVCLCIVGFFLIIVSWNAFFPAHIEQDWHAVVLGAVFLASGIGVLSTAYVFEKRLRRKQSDNS